MLANEMKRHLTEKVLPFWEMLADEKYGFVLRAKGIVECKCGKWLHFDYVPGEPDVRRGTAGTIGRLCVIGSGINEAELKQLFNI